MVVIELTGGLGNQMFQYAFGKSCSLVGNTKLFLDDSCYEHDSLRSFALDCFNINEERVSKKQLDRIIKEPFIFNKLKSFLNYNQKYYKGRIIEEQSFRYDTNFPRYRNKNVLYKGYWQSEKYFSKFRSELLCDFQLSRPLSQLADNYLKQVTGTNSVSIHVRRGDYVNNEKTNLFHGVCSLHYYKEAVAFFLEKLPDVHFFIFSDDIEWVKREFAYISNLSIIENVPFDYEELYLMSQCKHNIIANSSFSWWGAWLNENVSKIVIAPQKWFENKEMQDQTRDLIPENWIKI